MCAFRGTCLFGTHDWVRKTGNSPHHRHRSPNDTLAVASSCRCKTNLQTTSTHNNSLGYMIIYLSLPPRPRLQHESGIYCPMIRRTNGGVGFAHRLRIPQIKSRARRLWLFAHFLRVSWIFPLDNSSGSVLIYTCLARLGFGTCARVVHRFAPSFARTAEAAGQWATSVQLGGPTFYVQFLVHYGISIHHLQSEYTLKH